MIGIIDDDAATGQAIQKLIRVHGFPSECFESANAFLASGRTHEFSCLILDVRMPGMTGLELQNRLVRRQMSIPTIFITGFVDDSVLESVRHSGTVAILEKPFEEGALIAQIKAIYEKID
jgi:FixJ family two-component response regulator